jgi:hypothetical protein
MNGGAWMISIACKIDIWLLSSQLKPALSPPPRIVGFQLALDNEEFFKKGGWTMYIARLVTCCREIAQIAPTLESTSLFQFARRLHVLTVVLPFPVFVLSRASGR